MQHGPPAVVSVASTHPFPPQVVGTLGHRRHWSLVPQSVPVARRHVQPPLQQCLSKPSQDLTRRSVMCWVPHVELAMDPAGKDSNPGALSPESSPSTYYSSTGADCPSSPSSTVSSPPDSPRQIAGLSAVQDEHEHLRSLRDLLRSRISHADEVLEELSLLWGSCYLRLAARRLLESSMLAAGSNELDYFVEEQLRAVLLDARATGLEEEEDHLLLRAEAVLQEQRQRRLAEAMLKARQRDAQEDLRVAVAIATASVEEASIFADTPHLVQAKLRLVAALANGRHLGLPADELRKAEKCRRRIHFAIQDLRGVVRVCCRVRPLGARELACGDESAVRILDDSTLEIPEVGSFTFDGIFSPEARQEDIFEDCRDLIQAAVDGHNATIFSYGQTGAGKTYTMMGTPEDEGLAFFAIDELFSILESLPSDMKTEASASLCEMYNGQVIDLLRLGTGSANRSRLSTSQNESVMERQVRDRSELRSLLYKGMQRRAVGSHASNVASSRSHLILTIEVRTTDSITTEVINGKIVLCDLAGSERLKKSLSDGASKKEAIEINKSLAALGNVIEAAAGRRKQVPYRDHKLTQILQDSIGGTAKTLMIVHCSPAYSNINETTTSLRYGIRAKKVANARYSPSTSAGSVSNCDTSELT